MQKTIKVVLTYEVEAEADDFKEVRETMFNNISKGENVAGVTAWDYKKARWILKAVDELK